MAKNNHLGKKKSRSARPNRVPDLGYYLIVTDTEATERNFLNGLRDSLPEDYKNRIVIRVIDNIQTSSLISVCQHHAKYNEQYCKPWVMFDRDEVPNFNQIIVEATRKNIGAAWSNPCFEIWLEAYFGTMSNYLGSTACCNGFSSIFMNKTSKAYRKSDPCLYETLCRYGNENMAIKLAERRLRQCRLDYIVPSEMCPCTTVHMLIKEIRNIN